MVQVKLLDFVRRFNRPLIFIQCNRQGQDTFGAGRGYGRGMPGRMNGRGFGNLYLLLFFDFG
jgi:hypothetical protein